MASDTHIEEELDMITVFIRRRAMAWKCMGDALSITIAGEMFDLADEISNGKHWAPED